MCSCHSGCLLVHWLRSAARAFRLRREAEAGLCVRRLYFVQTVLPAVDRQISVLGRSSSSGLLLGPGAGAGGLQPPSSDAGHQHPWSADEAASSLGVSDLLCAVMAESGMGEDFASSSDSGPQQRTQQQQPGATSLLPTADAGNQEQVRALVIQQYTDLVCSLSRSLMTLKYHPGQTSELSSLQSRIQRFRVSVRTAWLCGMHRHGTCRAATCGGACRSSQAAAHDGFPLPCARRSLRCRCLRCARSCG